VPGEDRHSIVIEIDPSKASRGSADVVKGLEEVNATLRTIGNLAISELAKITAGMNGIAAATTRARSEVSALSGLAASFGRLGETIKAARDRTDQLNTALTTMRGFEGLTAAIQRQESVLERIHGPMREYEADLAAINHLYQRGALSALEYTSEVNRMNAAIGKTPKPGGGSQIGEGLARGAGVQGLLTGGAAGLAAAGAQAAVSSIGAIGDMSDAYTNLDNRLRKVTADEETRAELLQRTKQIAQESRSEWASTGELFVRLSNSTKDLNLGQERTLRLTETISKAFAMSGASASESAGAMLQLSQAFASGHLQGDEFRSMAEAVPDVMDLIAKQMHVTRGELKQLGSDGKISSDVIVAAFESAQRDIDSGFARTAPTLSQSWTMFKNDMTETVAKLVKDTDLLPTVASAFKDLAGAISTVADALHTISSIKDSISGVTDKLPTAPTPGLNPLSLQDRVNAYGEKLKDPFGMDTHFTQQEVHALTGATPGQRRVVQPEPAHERDAGEHAGLLRGPRQARDRARRCAPHDRSADARLRAQGYGRRQEDARAGLGRADRGRSQDAQFRARESVHEHRNQHRRIRDLRRRDQGRRQIARSPSRNGGRGRAAQPVRAGPDGSSNEPRRRDRQSTRGSDPRPKPRHMGRRSEAAQHAALE
jgi:tape measure domain-containing protein